MSKQLTAADEQQGCSTSVNLTKAHNAVKEIDLLLANEVILPLESAVMTFEQLEALLKTVGEIASAPVDTRSDHATAKSALVRIKTLCEAGAYLAADKGNFVDFAREEFRDKHISTILAAIAGGDQS